MILVDSNVLIAQLVPSDQAHGLVTAYRREFPAKDIVIPSPVIFETCYFIARDRGPHAEALALRLLVSSARIEDPTNDDYLRAADLVEQYADFPLGTVDALIVAMAERLGVTTLLTLDRRHFGAIRPAHCESFELVP